MRCLRSGWWYCFVQTNKYWRSKKSSYFLCVLIKSKAAAYIKLATRILSEISRWSWDSARHQIHQLLKIIQMEKDGSTERKCGLERGEHLLDNVVTPAPVHSQITWGFKKSQLCIGWNRGHLALLKQIWPSKKFSNAMLIESKKLDGIVDIWLFQCKSSPSDSSPGSDRTPAMILL